MAVKEYGELDAIGLADLVRRKQVSPTELLDEAIARTEKVDGQINAVVVRHYDFARQAIANGLPEGPFRGVPFLLKDLNLLAGTRTTFGASVYKDYIADHDHTVSRRFVDAGLVVFGKSASPEFGLMPTTETRLFGPTRNPWNTGHSSGGSSGGAAAAVAGAHPACRPRHRRRRLDPHSRFRLRVFGLKPTRGRTPMGPDRGEGWAGFSIGNVVSISVRDSAAMLDAIQGPELTSPYYAPLRERPYLEEVARAPGRLRIVFTDKAPSGAAIDPEIAAAVRDVAKMLEKLGHHVEEGAPVLPANTGDVMAKITGANTALTVKLAEAAFGRTMTDKDFERLTLASAARAKQTSGVDYVEAQLAAYNISRALYEFFVDVDVFLSPTLCQPPLKLGTIDTMGDLKNVPDVLAAYMPGTAMFNMSGQPAMSVPLAWNRAGLPLGMMFAGKFGDEATLFRLAAQLEAERPWKDLKPGVCA